MKKTRLWSLALAAVGTWLAMTGIVLAQDSTAPPIPHQIGLIDLAHIYKNYEKFKAQTAALEADAKEAESKAQQMMQQGQQWVARLKDPTLSPGSPDYNKLEADVIKLKSELDTFRAVEQREILRKQAEIYKEIYLEVQSLVNQYAQYYKYTLIIRFNRSDVSDAENPQAIIQNMNRQVVYFQTRDDITEPILKALNDQYRRKAGGAAPTAR